MQRRRRPVHFGRILMCVDVCIIGPHRHLLVRGRAAPVRRAGSVVSLGGGLVGPAGAFLRLLRTHSSMLGGLGVRRQTRPKVGTALM
ncbi:hypothetical protein GCM10009641_48430 [Mycobacterium cookii]|uniref:Uncharacterized protein n=1 Tax=Mycobacterium cookii TaxID=1775 RepID=A0A7I7KWS3_9MYCO|nr:hypothetical protein MCOO_22720 [Mycobacterium cookii]